MQIVIVATRDAAHVCGLDGDLGTLLSLTRFSSILAQATGPERVHRQETTERADHIGGACAPCSPAA